MTIFCKANSTIGKIEIFLSALCLLLITSIAFHFTIEVLYLTFSASASMFSINIP